MMRTFIRWIQSTQGAILTTLVIAVYYVSIYRPLNHRVQALDQPLLEAWNRLEQVNQESLSQDRLDLDHISRGLKQMEASLAVGENTSERLLSRIAIAPKFQQRSASPFQLIDFQNERQSIIEELDAQAKQSSINIAPQVFEGVPEFLSEHPAPHELWHELAIAQHILQSAITAGASSIDSLQATRPYSAPTTPNSGTASPVPLAAELEWTGKSSQLMLFLQLLPRRSDEIKTELGIDYPAFKPSLYVTQILARKSSRENPSEVSVWLKIMGLIYPQSTENITRVPAE
jgi:hypothetical protein